LTTPEASQRCDPSGVGFLMSSDVPVVSAFGLNHRL